MVTELRSRANFDEVLSLSREHLVVIDFFATWCPPCTRIAPHFQQLSEELPDVKFFKLDVDAVSDVARSEGIRAMPTFKLYRNGRCEETIQGGNLPLVRAAIERLRPPPTLLEPVLDLATAEPESERREAAGILVRIAGNILREPLNPKFRRLKVSNKIVTEKLLVVDGAMQCLIGMGFRDAEDAFVLDPEKALDEVRLVKSQIERVVLSEKGPNCGAAVEEQAKGNRTEGAAAAVAAATPSQVPTPAAPDALAIPLGASGAPASDQTAKFRATIARTVEMMTVYEQPHLQEKARRAMDWQALSSRVDIADTIALVRELLSWFKNDFFSWTDAPPCPSCDQKPTPSGSGQPTPAEADGWASRVELYRCPQHGEVRFPRFNHPGRLLDTRTGRCGEWANAFMLVLRAAGVRSRYVLDWTDHVWCEVFLKGRWVHCDPCEGALDKPLLYEAGWGKKLSYVLAFGRHDVQDVTWRYTQRPAEVLARRIEVPEAWLVSALVSTRRRLQSGLLAEERDAMTQETVKELVELLSPPRDANSEELLGRQSGSKEWRAQRGELGKEAFSGTIIRPLPEEVEAHRLEIRYSCALDHYERPLATNAHRISKGWRALVSDFSNVARKREPDWRMVYLARPEGCPASEPGFLEWTIDMTDSGVKVGNIHVMTNGAEFEGGQVHFTLHGDNNVSSNVRGLFTKNPAFNGCRLLKLRAEIHGGTGENAWQHAQMFRQKENDSTLFPLNIVIDFRKG